MRIGNDFLYVGAYDAKRIQNGEKRGVYELTEKQKAQIVSGMNEAAVKYKLFGEDYDYATISEEGRGFHISDQIVELESFDVEEEIAKQNAKFGQELQKLNPDDPFMGNVGQQWLVFSKFLYNNGFYDDKTMSEASSSDGDLRNITSCLDGFNLYQVVDKRMVSFDSPYCSFVMGSFNPVKMGSHAMRLELESATEALHYYSENYIEDEGLKKEFDQLISRFYDHNLEMMKGYRSAEESLDLARKNYVPRPHRLPSLQMANADTLEASRYLVDVTHSEEEEDKYQSEITSLIGQIKQPTVDWNNIWKQIQSTFLDYVTKGSEKQTVRQRAVEETGGIFNRMEKMWSNLLGRKQPAAIDIQS